MFANDRKYDDRGNLLQGEIQQLLVQIDHSHFCPSDDSRNLLEEEKDFVENPEKSEKCSNLESDRSYDTTGVRQQRALRLPPLSIPALRVSLHPGGVESYTGREPHHQVSPPLFSHFKHQEEIASPLDRDILEKTRILHDKNKFSVTRSSD